MATPRPKLPFSVPTSMFADSCHRFIDRTSTDEDERLLAEQLDSQKYQTLIRLRALSDENRFRDEVLAAARETAAILRQPAGTSDEILSAISIGIATLIELSQVHIGLMVEARDGKKV